MGAVHEVIHVETERRCALFESTFDVFANLLPVFPLYSMLKLLGLERLLLSLLPPGLRAKKTTADAIMRRVVSRRMREERTGEAADLLGTLVTMISGRDEEANRGFSRKSGPVHFAASLGWKA
jgi:hypothetical protein